MALNSFFDQINVRKLAITGLAIFALLLLAGWFLQFRSFISDPLPPVSEERRDPSMGSRGEDSGGAVDIPEGTETDRACPEGEDCVDTLSSYESDPEEGKSGVPPSLVSTGSDVAKTEDMTVSTSSISTSSASEGAETPLEQELSADDVSPELLEKSMQGEADADTLRQLLLEAGAEEEMVEQLPDDQLMNSYQRSLKEIGQGR